MEVNEYPKNDSALNVAENVVGKLFHPYFKNVDSPESKLLIQLMNMGLQKYSKIYGSWEIEDNNKINKRASDFGNTGYTTKLSSTSKSYTKVTNKKTVKKCHKTFIQNRFNIPKKNLNNDCSDKNDKDTIFFNEFNDEERRKVIIKHQIKNFKEAEAIKKYESIIVRTKTKSLPGFDEIHKKLGNFVKRANFDKNPVTNNKKSNNLNHKNDKMTDLNDGILKYKLETKQIAKIKNTEESKKSNPFYYKRTSKNNFRSPYAIRRHKKQRYIARRPYVCERRTPGTNRPPRDDIISPPEANRSPSWYIKPRYEYNFKRFNDNSNLTQRANSKQIPMEFSYSNEENDMKFYLADAIRHPYDLKSKIQQNSLTFENVQNGGHQIAPADIIRLKEELNYGDEEDRIKSNRYLLSF